MAVVVNSEWLLCCFMPNSFSEWTSQFKAELASDSSMSTAVGAIRTLIEFIKQSDGSSRDFLLPVRSIKIHTHPPSKYHARASLDLTRSCNAPRAVYEHVLHLGSLGLRAVSPLYHLEERRGLTQRFYKVQAAAYRERFVYCMCSRWLMSVFRRAVFAQSYAGTRPHSAQG